MRCYYWTSGRRQKKKKKWSRILTVSRGVNTKWRERNADVHEDFWSSDVYDDNTIKRGACWEKNAREKKCVTCRVCSGDGYSSVFCHPREMASFVRAPLYRRPDAARERIPSNRHPVVVVEQLVARSKRAFFFRATAPLKGGWRFSSVRNTRSFYLLPESLRPAPCSPNTVRRIFTCGQASSFNFFGFRVQRGEICAF